MKSEFKKKLKISPRSVQLIVSLLEHTKSIELSSKTLLFKYTRLLLPDLPHLWLNSVFH